ncbi:DGQHR domain-containing protein [Agrobacterium pusense]|uniref:DGQHR domain-containing protein n=1 Tax=Agrobacterium pusense TaxID=648995 RepID=UPI0022B93946|nr:DGQHR domain-containing protein [Agrobacterium pusense]MCZ7927295.1 DGQHR domain-containing protein [Agrobacterium pusense]
MVKATTKKPSKHTGKKTGALGQGVTVPALRVIQGTSTFYVFSMKASELWPMVSINRREETEDRGYQRVLSQARVQAVANHIKSGKPIPNSVLISLDKASYDENTRNLTIPSGTDIGWVIDGQHRIAGSHEASSEIDIELCVFAFESVDVEFQIDQFVTINREAKGVPTSLVYDLLSHLPDKKKPSDIAIERAAQIANDLRRLETSAFYNRIVVTQSPTKGKISITNFVRKVSPLVHPERGSLRVYTLPEMTSAIDNYFLALKKTYPEQWTKTDNVFFRTLGFGAMLNVFEEIFQITLTEQGGFTVANVESTLKNLKHFEFESWDSYGSGNKAEMEAASDFRTDFTRSRAKSVKGGLKL